MSFVFHPYQVMATKKQTAVIEPQDGIDAQEASAAGVPRAASKAGAAMRGGLGKELRKGESAGVKEKESRGDGVMERGREGAMESEEKMLNAEGESAGVKEKEYFLVNGAGTVHGVTRELARELLKDVKFRLATEEEIAEYRKRAVQRFDDPIAEPYSEEMGLD